MSGSTYGPNPWQQTQWDWRAAGNFVCGGAGAGLIVLGVACASRGLAPMTLLLAGLALIGVGLLCVWLEIGRPLRALHVFFNPRTSWMTREAFVAALLMPVCLATALGLLEFRWLAAVLALAFVYCQARIVQGAKGIPAWREPLVVPLLVLTGLAEGAGLLLVLQPGDAAGRLPLLGCIGALVLARALLWPVYQRRLASRAAPRALAALDAAGNWMQHTGSIVPLLLIAIATSGLVDGAPRAVLLAFAGSLIAATGAWLKFTLITRAGFNQGFTLAHLPVRGVRR